MKEQSPPIVAKLLLSLFSNMSDGIMCHSVFKYLISLPDWKIPEIWTMNS